MSTEPDNPPPNKKIRMSSKQEIQNTEPVLSESALNTIPTANSSENDTNKPPKQQTQPFHTKSHYVQKFELKNSNFEEYYRKQGIITDPDEWNLFLKTLQTELPTSFRFNPASPLYKRYKQKLLNDEYNLQKAQDDQLQHEGITFKVPYPMPFYPENMGWQCNFPKRFFNKHKNYFKPFRDFLIECNEIGIISRQETVSMIPGLFLAKYVSPEHIVLDMCAAPGNKTAQILELMHYNLKGEYLDGEHVGFVFANDADQKRGHVMVHQLKRLGINDFIITNKLAQCIPRMKDIYGTDTKFDNILCDVPCSSDGTLRKSPDLWKKWSTAYGNGLHSVQLSILIHALHLVKPGGHVVYSTCTFNPIENEAVIASALLKLNKYYSQFDADGNIEISVELVDSDKDVSGLKRNKGLSTWIVWDKNMENHCFYEKYSDVTEKRKKFAKHTMFPPPKRSDCEHIKDKVMDHLQLDRCMRFLPHYHDTGGFFVAVLHKKVKAQKQKKKVEKMDIDEKKDKVEKECQLADNATLFNIEKREFDRKNMWNDNVPYYQLKHWKDSKVQMEKLVRFYGLNVTKNNEEQKGNNDNNEVPYFDINELLVRGIENPRSLWFVSKSIGNIIANPDNHTLRVVHGGCRAFVRHDTRVTEHACKWRLNQDGAFYLSHYISKQIVRLPIELFLMYCFTVRLDFDLLEKIDDGKYGSLVNDIIRKQTGGPIITVLDEKDTNVMMYDIYKALSGWKSHSRIDLMIKKQQILLLQTHLKKIYKDECIALDAKYEHINIDFDVDDRRAFNQIKNTKKAKFKKKGSRDWVHRKKKKDK